jgi:ferredoxin
MRLAWLKKVRIAVSVVFFLALSLVFIDFANLFPEQFIKAVTSLQFMPSLIEFFQLFTVASGGFIFIVILTLLFGRVYCSSICPVGTLQDLIIYLKRKIRKKSRFRYLKPDDYLRYPVLAITVAGLLLGSTLTVNLLDPYSMFGKVSVNLFRPVVIGMNNLTSGILESVNNFWIKPVEIRSYAWASILFALFFFLIVSLLSIWKGRLYCNTVCPVGSLLGLFSRLSVFRISLDKERCTRCGACMVNCKAGCIDVKNREVDFSRCIGCFNCLSACQENGVLFRPVWKKNPPLKMDAMDTDLSKRGFLLTASALTLGAVTTAAAEPNKITLVRWIRNAQGPADLPVTPPGSLGIDHFTNKCTACHLCVSACPTQVLQPTFLKYGWQGMFQPAMDYRVSFCNYDCVLCTEVCPTGAILPLTFEQKKEVQLGKARFIREECIVTVKNTACGACSEHCPTKAVNMVPYRKGLTIPEVNPDICVGCGACEYACPTDPKSIVVDANAIHQKANKPPEQKKEERIDYKEEFPF